MAMDHSTLMETFSKSTFEDAFILPCGCRKERAEDFATLQSFDASYKATVMFDISVETLFERFDTERARFATSHAHHQARTYFGSINRWHAEAPTFKLTNCIVLGLGSLSGYPANRCETDDATIQAMMDTAMAQLVAFECWLGILREHFEIPAVYFQDASFSDVDREFLTLLGYEVIESPASNDVVSEETFLFAPNVPMSVVYATLMRAFPALYVGNSLHDEFEGMDCHDEREGVHYEEHPWLRGVIDAFLEPRGIKEFLEWSADGEDPQSIGSLYYLE